jgi:ABC-type proline/glycine betaine transport system permease subunit
MAYHHRIAAIALALALVVGVPAAAAAQQPARPSSPQARAHARRSARAVGTPPGTAILPNRPTACP